MTLNNANSRFEVEIPANEIGDQGVEYKIKATNTQGLEGTSSDYKGLNVFQSGISLPQIPAGSAQTDYRIIAIPITLSSNKGNDVFEELGAVDVNKWRMYRYENLATTEITSLASLTVEPGKGYWLISKSAVTISTGQGTAVDATSVTPFTINLVNGWNQIGNPYLFNLIWSDVNTANGTNLTLRTYNAGFNNDTKLDKFEGGFVQVASPISLKMPTAKNASGGRAAELPTVVKNSIDMPEWSVSLELKNGTMQTPFGGVGMSPDASISYDEHDDFTMPRFLDYLELNHSKKIYGMTYTKDIIPTTENYEWQFTVESNIEATTKMTWDNSYFGKNDKHIVLWDVEEKRSVDMREANQYSFKGNVAKTFQVFFGNKEYVQEKTALKSLIIHSLSPNPTEGETKIAFTLAGTEESFVQVKVMSLLGQSISTAFEGYLAGGFHEVTWSGKDSQGNKPAQGVYLVEVIQGKERGSKRLIVK